MKLKILITISLLCICSISFGQDFKNDLTSVKTIDNKIQEKKYSSDDIATADRLLLKTSLENISKKDKRFFSKKEWRKIKKQLLKNKKRLSKLEDGIHTYKAIDTIYLDAPSNSTKSSLSGW
ncbi:hypothetical protein [Aquimarina celericrescens]|uniref:Uncharacterized protein n=1 Tax=Aquimarina celericrescens TaxID=1964542 RepID=A0ABW5B4K3_9FLAO|nr:hypothetical protein [Aquimarina celericrescens]